MNHRQSLGQGWIPAWKVYLLDLVETESLVLIPRDFRGLRERKLVLGVYLVRRQSRRSGRSQSECKLRLGVNLGRKQNLTSRMFGL